MSTLTIAAFLAAAQAAPAPAGTTCADLTALRVPDVRIVAATEVKPDPVWITPENPGVRQVKVTKAFCRVQGVIEDEIGFELWLPAKAEWNGRMLGFGNGGFAGFFRYEGTARGVNRGFASLTTDTGHKISEVNWPIGHPRRLENLGHRGQHLTAVNSKTIIAAYYGQAAHHAYFSGCSGGGMQAMNEVQRYPYDYDGILAGAHGRSIVGISARWLASGLMAQNSPAANLTQADWKRIADAATAACDAKDGVKDGIINAPKSCRFDVGTAPGLTPEQAQTARALYGPVTGKDGRVLFPGFDPGVAYKPISSPGRAGEVFALWLNNDPNWDFNSFEAGRDVPAAEGAVPGSSFTNPNLEAFAARGGKLISYHGWTDEILPAQATIDYYASVVRYMGQPATDRFYKLYLPAGMDHCSGGAGADQFGATFPRAGAPDEVPTDPQHDMLSALVAWVEEGKAPGTLIASKYREGQTVMTRPICVYPQVVRYRGRGDTNDAASFVCARP